MRFTYEVLNNSDVVVIYNGKYAGGIARTRGELVIKGYQPNNIIPALSRLNYHVTNIRFVGSVPMLKIITSVVLL